jgi:hypothetical protein
MVICGRKNGCTGPSKTSSKSQSTDATSATTKLHELRDICCRDTPDNVEHVSPDHTILGLMGITTPKDANNTVTISPKLYEQMVDMSTIDMPETQEEDSSEDDEDKATGDNSLVCLLQHLLTQSLGLQMWTTQ